MSPAFPSGEEAGAADMSPVCVPRPVQGNTTVSPSAQTSSMTICISGNARRNLVMPRLKSVGAVMHRRAVRRMEDAARDKHGIDKGQVACIPGVFQVTTGHRFVFFYRHGAYGSRIFKVVHEKQCKVFYTPAKRNPNNSRMRSWRRLRAVKWRLDCRATSLNDRQRHILKRFKQPFCCRPSRFALRLLPA